MVNIIIFGVGIRKNWFICFLILSKSLVLGLGLS